MSPKKPTTEGESSDKDSANKESADKTQAKLNADDWPAGIADRIVDTIATVRTNTTDRVITAVRAIVYGLVAGVALIALIVLLTITLVRLADAYLPIGAGVGSATWAAHGFIGLLITILSLGIWKARSSTTRPIKIALILDLLLIAGVVAYGVTNTYL